MVKIALKISCEVDHINEITTSGPDFPWNLKLMCSNCREIDPAFHAVTETDEVPAFKGPGTFNFQMKCKFCTIVSSLDVVKDSVKPLRSVDNEKIVKQTAVIFDCRGLEPVEFDPPVGWIAKCEETGSVFTDVEFGSDGMWIAYDEKGCFPVSIEELKSEFVRV